jgi:hypothetical protein
MFRIINRNFCEDNVVLPERKELKANHGMFVFGRYCYISFCRSARTITRLCCVVHCTMYRYPLFALFTGTCIESGGADRPRFWPVDALAEEPEYNEAPPPLPP